MIAARTLRARRVRPFASLARFVPDGRAIAASAAQALLLELTTWPKPGLVSDVDRGSHDHMDAETFRASAAAIAPYLRALADAGAHGCGMGRLRIIGLEAEAAMFGATCTGPRF
jgi:triphosphoribosyl-dephospho-CoA synthase